MNATEIRKEVEETALRIQNLAGTLVYGQDWMVAPALTSIAHLVERLQETIKAAIIIR